MKHWLKWLRLCSKDSNSPARIPRGTLGALTGQDARALGAIAECWELYSNSDADGQAAALGAVRALLPAVQPQCRFLAKELIAMALDWPDRDRLWPFVNVIPWRGELCPVDDK